MMVRIGLGIVVLGVAFFLMLPVFAVVWFSFAPGAPPPQGLSPQQYLRLASDPDWLGALWVSIRVALLACFFALLAGVPAAVALARRLTLGGATLNWLLLAALLTPAAVSAVAVHLTVVPLGLAGSIVGLACVHAVAGIALVAIGTAASLRGADRNLEHAAVIHGAGPLAAFVRVTLPTVWPGIAAGLILSFAYSLHELPVARVVLAGPEKPVSVKLWAAVQGTNDPSAAAVSTMLVGMAILTVIGVAACRALAIRRST